MATLICTAAILLGSPCSRGGAAIPVPPARGGAAEILAPVGSVAAWLCIHNGTPVRGGAAHTVGQGEGAWNADGFYHGGLQMDRSFEEAYGRDMLAKYGGRDAGAWTPRDQMVVAERGREARGYYPWPETARACGLI